MSSTGVTETSEGPNDGISQIAATAFVNRRKEERRNYGRLGRWGAGQPNPRSGVRRGKLHQKTRAKGPSGELVVLLTELSQRKNRLEKSTHETVTTKFLTGVLTTTALSTVADAIVVVPLNSR